MTAPMRARRGAHFTSKEHQTHRSKVERQPDHGNVIHINCRHCETPTLLDPARMENRKVGIFLLCRQCGRRFLVRHTDIHRPAPDAEVASLYTTPSPKQASRWQRLLRRRS